MRLLICICLQSDKASISKQFEPDYPFDQLNLEFSDEFDVLNWDPKIQRTITQKQKCSWGIQIPDLLQPNEFS